MIHDFLVCQILSPFPHSYLTDTVPAIGGELETCITDALEAAFCVEAPSILTKHPIVQALINVFTENYKIAVNSSKLVKTLLLYRMYKLL